MKLKFKVKAPAIPDQKWHPVQCMVFDRRGNIVEVITCPTTGSFPCWWTLRGGDLKDAELKMEVKP